MGILSRVAEAVVEWNNQMALCGRSFSPAVKEQTFKDLVAEFRTSGPHLRSLRHGA